METILQRNPDIKGVIAGNDTMALGAVAALKAAEAEEQVMVVGFDGSPDAIAAIKAGDDGGHRPAARRPRCRDGRRAGRQGDQTGKSTGAEEKQSIDCELITKENADDYGVFAKKS